MSPDQFRTWRKRLSLSQAAAAASLGLSKPTVERYEAGIFPIPKSVALACAAISLGLTDYPEG